MKAQEYSAVVETPRRRAGITNKPKVVQPNETHQEPKRKEKGCSGPGTKPRRGIHCLGLTLKTHQKSKKTRLIPGSCCRIREAASVRILQATRERQNTLNTKLNYAVNENDRASATTNQHQDSQHRQKAYMSQIATHRIRITMNRQADKRMSGPSRLQREAATNSLLLSC